MYSMYFCFFGVPKTFLVRSDEFLMMSLRCSVFNFDNAGELYSAVEKIEKN